jgi:hypothetical protein
VPRVVSVLGTIALVAALSSCSGSAGSPTTTSRPATSTVPSTTPSVSSAARLLKKALADGQARRSLHYVSVSSYADGAKVTIVGDVNRTAGFQTIVISADGERGTMAIELIGNEAYFRGDRLALVAFQGLTPAQAMAAAGRWVSVVPSDPSFTDTAAALTVASVISEVSLTPPLGAAKASSLAGRPVVDLSGAWVGSGVPQHATAELAVSKGAVPLPVRFSGAAGTIGSDQFLETTVLSRWGEPVSVTAPRTSVPLSTITSAGTTTTQPTIAV